MEVVEGQHLAVFLGALLDYWLGKTLVIITQGDATQISSNVSQGASVQNSLTWSAVETRHYIVESLIATAIGLS